MGLYRYTRRLGSVESMVALVLIVIIFVMAKQIYDTYGLDNYNVRFESARTKEDGNHQPHVSYDHNVPLIWVGGVPRSGTTLARALLDSHPDIRCGEETHAIPAILLMHSQILKNPGMQQKLEEAKMTEDILGDALGAYLLSVITKHGEPAERLCNKDPFTSRHVDTISKIFPRSKFILMIRDGRATAHSIISRKVGIQGFDFHTYRGALRDWNRIMDSMYNQCISAGKTTCLPVFYEQLVLHPKAQMERVLQFLNVQWSDNVIHHEKMIGQEEGIALSKKEVSTDQVVNPINTAALSKWVGDIPEDVLQDMDQIAPMLRRLGYDPFANPPNYGKPDREVAEHSKNIHLGPDIRRDRLKDVEKLERHFRRQNIDYQRPIRQGPGRPINNFDYQRPIPRKGFGRPIENNQPWMRNRGVQAGARDIF